MKKIITLTICIALICSSIAPVFAATDNIQYFLGSSTSTRIDAYSAFVSIISYLAGFDIDFGNIFELMGDGTTPTTFRSFQDIGLILDVIGSEFLYAQDINPNHYSMVTWLYATCDKIVGDIYTDIASTNSTVSSIASYLFNDQDAYLSQLSSNIYQLFYSRTPTFFNPRSLPSKPYPYWTIRNLDDQTFGSTYMNTIYNWSSGHDMLDFIANVLAADNKNFAIFDEHLLLDVDSQLSIWDSQGNTLTQSTWTPTSGFNGLYKYLAYTQRDVARLTHVYASDEEIAARDAARQNQTTVVNNFVDGNGVGSVSASDLGDMASVSGSLQSNFDTGASVSGVFAFFSNGSSTNWFSQATKNALDTNQTRSDSSDTPLLDAYYEEIYDLLGIGDDNR